jgi:hypothetical protein
MFSRELLDCRLQSLSRTTNFAARIFRAEMLFTSAMPTHAEKNRGRRVLFPLKRANIAAFCLSDRAAGPVGPDPDQIFLGITDNGDAANKRK